MGFPIWLSTHVTNIIRYSNLFQNPTMITNLLNCASFDNMVSHAWRPGHIRYCIAKTGLCHQMWLISTLTVLNRVINTKYKEFPKLRSSEILWNSTRQSIACENWDFWHPYLRTYFLLLRRQILIRNRDHHNIVKITTTWSIALVILYWWFHHVHMKTLSKLPGVMSSSK